LRGFRRIYRIRLALGNGREGPG